MSTPLEVYLKEGMAAWAKLKKSDAWKEYEADCKAARDKIHDVDVEHNNIQDRIKYLKKWRQKHDAK